jgi:cell division protein FtsQ
MSSKIKSIFIILGIAVTVSYITFSIVSFSGKGGEKTCKRLDISIRDTSDLRFITEKQVAFMLQDKGINPIGIRMNKINLTLIEKTLLAHPVIKEVQCYKTPNGTLKVDIWQRKPLFRVISNGENYYVDEDSKIIPISEDFSAYVPIITGNVNKKFATTDLFNFIVFLRKNKFWDSQIEQINVNNDNTIELIPRVGNNIITLGTLDGYQEKLNKLMKLYEGGLNTLNWNQYSEINLEYKNQIICTKNTQPCLQKNSLPQ